MIVFITSNQSSAHKILAGFFGIQQRCWNAAGSIQSDRSLPSKRILKDSQLEIPSGPLARDPFPVVVPGDPCRILRVIPRSATRISGRISERRTMNKVQHEKRRWHRMLYRLVSNDSRRTTSNGVERRRMASNGAQWRRMWPTNASLVKNSISVQLRGASRFDWPRCNIGALSDASKCIAGQSFPSSTSASASVWVSITQRPVLFLFIQILHPSFFQGSLQGFPHP